MSEIARYDNNYLGIRICMGKQNNGGGVTGSFWPELMRCWRQLPNKYFFFALLAAWLALFHFFGSSTFGYIDTPSLLLWMHNDYTGTNSESAHGMLIPFVVLGLLWWKREKLLAFPHCVWWPGLLLLAAALALHVLGYMVQQARLSIVALFAGCYALTGLAWGPRWLRATFFPIFLFVFCVPLGPLAEPITFPLRLLVTQIVTGFSQAVLGIDVIRDGTRIFNPDGRYEYEIAAACSGLRSLVATVAIALVYALVSFQKWWKRLALIGSAVPLAVIGNVVRMMTIIIGAEFGGQAAGAYVHEGGPLGILSLLPYVPVIAGLLLLGRWLEETKPPASAGKEVAA